MFSPCEAGRLVAWSFLGNGRKAAGMSRRQLFILFGVVALASFLAGPLLWNPLRRPSGFVRSWLFGKTPVGTSRSEVEALVKSQGWSIAGQSHASLEHRNHR